MTKSIWDIYDSQIKDVRGYALISKHSNHGLKEGQIIGKVVFKYPKNGYNILYAYVHIFGLEMTRGQASGYGYDKHRPTIQNALKATQIPNKLINGKDEEMNKFYRPLKGILTDLEYAFYNYDGLEFYDTFRKVGYDCQQIV